MRLTLFFSLSLSFSLSFFLGSWRIPFVVHFSPQRKTQFASLLESPRISNIRIRSISRLERVIPALPSRRGRQSPTRRGGFMRLRGGEGGIDHLFFGFYELSAAIRASHLVPVSLSQAQEQGDFPAYFDVFFGARTTSTHPSALPSLLASLSANVLYRAAREERDPHGRPTCSFKDFTCSHRSDSPAVYLCEFAPASFTCCRKS